MAEDNPSFFTQPLPEEPKKRTVRKRTSTTTRTRRTTTVKDLDNKKISQKLNDIYRDADGKIPNMNEIKIKKESGFFKKTFTFLLVVGLLVAAAWVGFFMMPNKKINDSEVVLNINGPEKVTFGATSTYNVVIENKQNISIKDINLTIRYPESFVFVTSSAAVANQGNSEWNLGNLSGGKELKLQISGIYYGALEQDQSWRVSARYQPENFNSEMQRSAVKTVRIINSPYTVTLTGPDKIAISTEAEYTITLEDREGNNTNKFVIQNQFPSNFYVTTSTPALEKNNTWIIMPTSSTSTPTLPIKQTFKVVGKFGDSEEKTSIIKSSLIFASANKTNYQIGATEITTELIKNSISLQTAINGSLDKISTKPGDNLIVTIAAKNESREKMTKGTIKLFFAIPAYKKTSVIDWAQIADKSDGDVVGKQISDTIRQATITWDRSKISTLNNWKAGQEINIEFQVPLKDTKTVDWGAVTENKINVTSEITFTDASGATQTISGKPLDIIINSDLSLEVREEIDEASEPKTHNITWVLNNNVHPLKNIVLSADIYGDVTIVEPITAPAGKITYNKTDKKLTWEIEQMGAETDVLALPFSIKINKKNPTQNLLVSKVRVQAEDTVTGEKIDLMGEEIPLKTE